ncbi:aminotransferase class I/II-fold pyridoxal phosphate-dependent enzyme [uncultured Bacteroides sp.]|uniref:aminotransferase class I/II-fold pyridoxal phosphate-dependent enzyme n=1 Tax=uncultured Bacteroides sp. TaxID=162156 RepID=UPI0026350197|nr:aminotransferase class I/II-fold pyridoxal phosphate-dependent enzyme [uncultured Bacteroides sp.]
MQAVILAAGMGKRLGELTKGNTKCMVRVNGVSLIDRVLTQLSAINLSRIIIVIGYQGKKLQEYLGDSYQGIPLQYIENPIYDKTNNIYSLSLAKKELQEDDTLLIESDLILDDTLFPMLVNNPYPNLALVAKYETWMDGTMVCIDEANRIVNFVSKQAFKYSEVDSYYKTVNVYKFSREFSSSQYVPFLEAYTKALGNNEYYEQVLRVVTLLDNCPLKALPLDRQKWYEIDDVQDLDIAETIFSDEDKQLPLYQKRYGGYWRFPDLLDFCYLVNPYFPPQKLKEELKANFDVLLSEYPSGMRINSLLISKYFHIKKEYAVVGNGAAELIKSLMRYLDGKIGVVFPTFEEYPNRYAEDRLVRYIPQNENFTYSASDLKDFFSDKSISTLLLINPDNPSGNFIPYDDLISLALWTEECGIRLVIDESFVDFSVGYEQNTLLRNEVLSRYPHLAVMKSISKSYGVPGLRLGVLASANHELIEWMKKDVAIWNINSFAEFYMQIFGKYENDYKHASRLFVEERDRFRKELSAISWLRVIPSQANYFLCEVLDKYSSKDLMRLLLMRYNIFIKDCSTKFGFEGKNYIRIAVRDKVDNDKLVESLKSL